MDPGIKSRDDGGWEVVPCLQPVTPWLDHGVHAAGVAAGCEGGGMDPGIKSRDDGGWEVEGGMWGPPDHAMPRALRAAAVTVCGVPTASSLGHAISPVS